MAPVEAWLQHGPGQLQRGGRLGRGGRCGAAARAGTERGEAEAVPAGGAAPAQLPCHTSRLRTRDEESRGRPAGWGTAAQLSDLLWPWAPAALCRRKNLDNTFPLPGPAGTTISELLPFQLRTWLQVTTCLFPCSDIFCYTVFHIP